MNKTSEAQKVLLTIQEFGKLYGPKTTKTYALLKSGELKGVKNGRCTYIPQAEAEKWAQNLPSYTPQSIQD